MLHADWPTALREWQRLFVHGNPDAAKNLCELYIDGRQGKFDADQATRWCRRAAGAGDAHALQRMGLLYLTGVGLSRNAEQAELFCLEAEARDPSLGAAFCVAAAAEQRARAARAMHQSAEAPRQDVASPKAGGLPANAASANELCDRYFHARGKFDAADAVAWCRQAADANDPAALRSIGMLYLAGVGVPQDLAKARTSCVHAEQLDPHFSSAFCLAAVAAEQQLRLSRAQAGALGSVDPDPTTGLALPKTVADPFELARVLDEPRTTPAGLNYSCRDLTKWARYEAPRLDILTPRDRAFGKAIVEYRAADFADLERAAKLCASALSPLDTDGTIREDLRLFSRALTHLKAQQATLLSTRSDQRQEAVNKAQDRTEQQARLVLSTQVLLSPQEQACVDEIRRAWAVGDRGPEQTTLEIKSSHLDDENGDFVVRGKLRVLDNTNDRMDVISASDYSCTFIGHGDTLARSVVLPNKQ